MGKGRRLITELGRGCSGWLGLVRLVRLVGTTTKPNDPQQTRTNPNDGIGSGLVRVRSNPSNPSNPSRIPASLIALLLLLLLLATPAFGQIGTTTRVSVSSSGEQGNDFSEYPSISADGRFVAFESDASNLVAGDTNGARDVFVHDRQTGATARVSVSSDGGQGSGHSGNPSISADGRFVAFYSVDSNLVAGDTNGLYDVFVHDQQTGATTRVSVSSAGGQGSGHSAKPSISADGQLVAFYSYASNLVAGDTNVAQDVFVHDRQTGVTTRVSVSSARVEGNSISGYDGLSISADGRFVAFESDASNLVAGDTNGARDVFVHDRQTGTTTRVSLSSAGGQGSDHSVHPSISADGRFVAFDSIASNLVAGDTNGLCDVFVNDRQTGTTTRASVSSSGLQGNSDSGPFGLSISADGRFVAFYSEASSLVAGDTNGTSDGFMHDRQTGVTTRVSLSSAGVQGNENSWSPSISADGRFVAFDSIASNLVAGDTNSTNDIFVHQYGPGEGWGNWTPPNQTGGNTIGDAALRDLKQFSSNQRPIILVHGMVVDVSPFGFIKGFIGGPNGGSQWDGFVENFEDITLGFRRYDPVTNPNGLIFVCNTLDTRESVASNAARLNNYIDSIKHLPQFQASPKFDMVGYSMGGLIARKWEHGYDNGSGNTKRLRNLVTTSSPHEGLPLADWLWWTSSGVYDLTTTRTAEFNRTHKGFLGVRYSRIAADIRFWLPGLGVRSDGAVTVDSQQSDSWKGSGFPGSVRILPGLAHVDLRIWFDVRNATQTALAVYEAIYGAGLPLAPDSHEPTAPESHTSLSVQTTLFPSSIRTQNVPVPSTAGTLGLSASWNEGGAAFVAVEPGGRVINPTVAASDPTIEYSLEGSNASYTITTPRPGLWTLRLSGASSVPTAGTECRFGASDVAPVTSDPVSPVLVRQGASARFLVSLQDGSGKLPGGAVQATLYPPGSAPATLLFYDDGQHGDGPAADGLFGSNFVSGTAAGTYAVQGRITGTRTYGTVARLFTTSFDASPETGRILNLVSIQPTDDPDDSDAYYDLLRVNVKLNFNAVGTYLLSGELAGPQGQFIDHVTEVVEPLATGQLTATLKFRGQVIGEAMLDGPYSIRNVRLTDQTNQSVMTDYLATLGTTSAYSKLLFEAITARTATPANHFAGTNLISLPLDPVEGLRIRAILGGNVQFIGPWSGNRLRGMAIRVAWRGPIPTMASYLGSEDDTEFPVTFEKAGPQTVGCPYNRPLPLSRFYVKNNATGAVRTAASDRSSATPWVDWSFSFQQGGVWKLAKLVGGDDNQLRPWFGYSFRTNIPNVTITFRG